MAKKIFKRLKLILLELLNFITDLIVPFLEIVIVVIEVLPVNYKYVKMLKNIEEILKKVGATAGTIDLIMGDKDNDN